MMPLAKAVRKRGHEVRWATGPDSCGWVAEGGIPAIPAGVEQHVLLARLDQLPADVRALPRAAIPDAMFGRIFGGVAAPAMLAGLAPVVAGWIPDLVVHDAAEFAGPLIAARLGVPWVTKAFGMVLPAKRVAVAATFTADLWRAAGLDPLPFGGCYQQLYVDICPTALQPSVPKHVHRRQPMRPVSEDAVAAGPRSADMNWAPGFPTVYLTLGTVFKNITLLRTAVAGVAELGVGVLITVGSRMDPADLGRQPAHVRIEHYVPQSMVLGRCRVVVSHGGSGTTYAALSHGLPQLCLPQGADQFLNAAGIERCGAGLALMGDDIDAGAVAGAVDRLLREPSFRSAAEGVAAEIARMPGPDEVAGVLERFTG
jgi:UDP:flavonoid glycosyltransferase YjiC (YdhE family)